MPFAGSSPGRGLSIAPGPLSAGFCVPGAPITAPGTTTKATWPPGYTGFPLTSPPRERGPGKIEESASARVVVCPSRCKLRARPASPAVAARHREQVDRTEGDISRSRDPVEAVERSAQRAYPEEAERRDDGEAHEAGDEGPRHAARALAGEVDRHAGAEEKVDRRHAPEVGRSGLHHAGLGAEEVQPGGRKSRRAQADRP